MTLSGRVVRDTHAHALVAVVETVRVAVLASRAKPTPIVGNRIGVAGAQQLAQPTATAVAQAARTLDTTGARTTAGTQTEAEIHGGTWTKNAAMAMQTKTRIATPSTVLADWTGASHGAGWNAALPEKQATTLAHKQTT